MEEVPNGNEHRRFQNEGNEKTIYNIERWPLDTITEGSFLIKVKVGSRAKKRKSII